MNWEAIGAIAELLGAFAIIITLVYLTIQVRQTASAQEQQNALTAASIMQSRTDTVFNFVDLITTSDDNLTSVARYTTHPELFNANTMSEQEIFRIKYLVTSARALFENICEQNKKGFLSDDFYSGAAIKNIQVWGELWLSLETPMTLEFDNEVKRIVSANSS